MVAASYVDGCLAHEVQCMETELRLSRANNAKLRQDNARARQDLREFALDINMRCARIAELEKENDRLTNSFDAYRRDHK